MKHMTLPTDISTEHATNTQHLRHTGRLVGLDLARAIAIFGMFWAHVSPWEEHTGLAYVLNELPSGRSALLFALLAGISLAILTGRNIPYSGTDMLVAKLRIVGRAIGLFAIAALLELLEHPIAIILGFYALWFLIGLFFVRKTAKFLLIFGFASAVIGSTTAIVLQTLAFHFSVVGGYAANELMMSGFVTGMYPGLSYLPVVIVGMGIGRLEVRTVKQQLRWLIAGVLLASISYATSWGLTAIQPPVTPPLDQAQPLTAQQEASSLRDYYSTQLDIIDQLLPKTTTLTTEEFWQLMSTLDTSSLSTTTDVAEETHLTFSAAQFITAEAHSNTPFEILGGIGVGIAIVMACMMLTQIPLAQFLLRPVIAAGAMPLTIYSAHIVAFAMTGEYFSYAGLVGVVWLVLPALVFAPLWLWKFKRGPLEWLLYRLSAAIARA